MCVGRFRINLQRARLRISFRKIGNFIRRHGKPWLRKRKEHHTQNVMNFLNESKSRSYFCHLVNSTYARIV